MGPLWPQYYIPPSVFSLPPLLLCVRNWLFLIDLRYFLPAQPLLTLEPTPYHLCSILATVKPFNPVSSPQSQDSCTAHCGPVWDPCGYHLTTDGSNATSCRKPSLSVPESASFLKLPAFPLPGMFHLRALFIKTIWRATLLGLEI